MKLLRRLLIGSNENIEQRNMIWNIPRTRESSYCAPPLRMRRGYSIPWMRRRTGSWGQWATCG